MSASAVSLQDPAWHRALDLTERLATLPAAAARPNLSPAEEDAARSRLQAWKEQPPFTNGALFAQRLAADRLGEDDLLYLLGESGEALRDRVPQLPQWLTRLAAALADPAAAAYVLPFTDQVRDPSMVPFLNAIKPLVKQGLERLEAGIADLVRGRPHVPFAAETVRGLLLANLPGHVVGKLTRTIALEVNVARLHGQLQGGDPQTRFESFVQRMEQTGGLVALLEEYPVMARQLVVAIDNWVEAWLEFLGRLCADWEQIRTTFAPDHDPGPLVGIDGGAGDSHQGGRTVVIVEFASGLRLVYKPKPLAVDVHFQELLVWLNQRGDFPPFRTLRVLDRGAYGWSEYVRPCGCATRAEVERFYRRQGGALALLYVLEATDFHSENLIAAGEHPVLVDLEALFQPRVGGYYLEWSVDPALRTVEYSVLRVNLLPERVDASDRVAGVDISALGNKAGQLCPHPVARWEGFGTDEMRVVHRQVELAGSDNRPTWDGKPVDVLDYLGHFEAGFREVYRLLLAYRDELLAGPLERFRDDEIRLIARATKTYNNLLRPSFHPDLLRDALERDRFFDRLWIPVEDEPFLTRLIASERADLLRGDVPKFTTRVNSRDVYGSRGDVIPGLLETSSLDSVRRRVQQLSPSDLERQLWFIRASVATLPLGKARETWKSSQLAPSDTVVTPALLRDAARAVGDRLGELALWDGDAAAWVGMSIAGDVEWKLVPAGFDLYSGASGIGLFLAYLGALTGEAAYTSLARAALQTVQRQLAKYLKQSAGQSPGAFNGLGSPIYLLAHLGPLWNEPALLDEAERLAARVPELIEKDEMFDLMAGAAGTILALLSLHRAQPSPATLAAAVRCGEHLVRHARRMPHGVGWTSPLPSAGPLTGLAHGAAGIGLGLLALAHASGDERFRQTGLAALEYERSVFSPKYQNWPGLRTAPPAADGQEGGPDASKTLFATWCYGAPGIGLGRLACLQYADDPALREEIDVAIRTTVQEGFGFNHCLCHGDLGNLDLLLVASRVQGAPDSQQHLARLTPMIVDSIRKHGWITGIPLGTESPELMTGLAGIGYMLLRLADPDRVPSVLLLEAVR
jgi:type 2 lantibiotic biosynthesis protein LanM